MLQVTLAILHLLALGLGLGAVLNRGTALREPPTAASLRRVFRADTVWAIAGFLWIATGLVRWFGAIEKPEEYYSANMFFIAKMSLLAVVLILEVGAMVTLIRWRRAAARGESPEAIASPARASQLATLSHVQALLVVLMVLAAVAMARGFGS